MNKAVMKSMRLDRLLSNMGYGSRREIDKMAAYDQITLDGQPLQAAEQRINLTADLGDRLRINGTPLDPLPGMVVMLHKPLGVTCSHKESGDLVYDLFPERWRRRQPPLSTIGRLDKETSGLLLLTDDGQFLHRIISPRSHIAKRYHVTLAEALRGDEEKLFASGEMMLEGDDKPLLPVILQQLSPLSAYVLLTEGRYHQIRRMFEAVRNKVTALHRDRIGGLSLPDDLLPGQYRLLTGDEIDDKTGSLWLSEKTIGR